MTILNNLNDMQRLAAEKIEGPSLILAGAGSGKTRTITYKIAYMVNEKNILPQNILALTFTNKAANEMKTRVLDLIDISGKYVTISTFHSFSVKLLRQYGSNIGFPNNFNIYDADDSKNLIKSIIKENNINTNLSPSVIYSKISKNKEDEIGPEEYAESVNLSFVDNKVFYDIFRIYQERLIKSACMDFSDILLNCLKLLKNENVLRAVQEKYKYILVDEYQDTNNIQYQIISKIASKYRNICVVGDEDQSIYAFRGANIQNILDFEKDYNDAFVVKLEENYRSTPNILNLANSVITNNKSSLGKTLWTKNELGKNTTIFEASDPYDEAKYICDIVKTSKKRHGSFTVLYRTNAQSRVLEQELTRNGIACKVYGGLSFYQRKEIKDLLAYLLFLNNPNDFISFERAISNPKRKIGEKSIQNLLEISRSYNVNLLEALKIEGSKKSLEFYNLLIEFYHNVNILKISELLKTLVDKISYMEYLKSFDNVDERISNIFELYASIEELEKIEEDITLDEYLTFASLASSTDNIDEKDIVKLMTIHSSKGLEFENVFIVGFENGIFPSKDNLNSPKELEEERRLCYVAITRAKKELYITYCSSRMFRGVTEYFKEPSIFFNEMDKKYISYVNKMPKTTYEKPKTKIENFNPFNKELKSSNSKFKIGQIVNHIAYGKGKITFADDKKIVIDFASGEKKISALLADKFIK